MPVWVVQSNCKKRKAGQSISENKQKKELEAEPVVEPVAVTANNDEEIVAVIAAAIAMAESESNGIKFKVVSFRRV